MQVKSYIYFILEMWRSNRKKNFFKIISSIIRFHLESSLSAEGSSGENKGRGSSRPVVREPINCKKKTPLTPQFRFITLQLDLLLTLTLNII